MIVGIAFGVALAATAFLALHVYRRLPTMPKRMPLGIGIDGRARKGRAPRAFVWVIPAALALAVVGTGFALLTAPPDPDQQPLPTLVLVELAVVAGLMVWVVDRLVELGRDQTFRVKPSRLLVATLPTLAGIVLIAVVAAR
jgi:hypothetical protein